MAVATEQTTPVLAVIPARYGSTRFPGKIVTDLAGKPLVWHTYTRTCQAARVTRAVVATDDARVVEALAPYDVPVVMTRTDHASGTDRIAEVAGKAEEAVIVNVQGDEPLIDPQTIDDTVGALLADDAAVMATAKHRITDPELVTDPNAVKVVCDGQGRALYFSRAPIPHIRDAETRATAPPCYWLHLGLYAYRRDFLLRYAQLPRTPLEQLEMLEQLRVLESGYEIVVVETAYEAIGVDTPADLERVKRLLAAGKGS